MKLTAEMSLYPLNEQYVEVIKDFVRAVRLHDDLTVVTNAMSTQVCGDYDRVVEVIGLELRASYERHGKQVLVCKYIVGELDVESLPQF